jgi:c-di-GMP-binding flagellar brake protein YcgR
MRTVEIELMDASQRMMKERRSSARIDAPYPARLRGVDVNDQPFKEETVLQNLSAGGLYLRLKRMVREGAQVSLAVRLSTAESRDSPVLRLGARGTVLRVEPQADGSYGIAVEFLRRHIF